jgi:hypothetical protein
MAVYLMNLIMAWVLSNTHWVGDITYIKTYQGWSYLASVLDLSSKQVGKNPLTRFKSNFPLSK